MAGQSKKTVLYILDDFNISGAVSLVSSYANYFVNKGYKVIIIGQYGDFIEQETNFRGCLLFYIPKINTHTNSNFFKICYYRTIYLLRIASLFRRVIRENKVDVVHFNLYWSALSVLLLCPQVYRYDRYMNFYCDMSLEFKYQNPSFSLLIWMKANLFYFVHLICLHLSTYIIVLSEYSREMLKRRFLISKNKIIYISGAIERKNYLLPSCNKFKYLLRPGYLNIVNISRFEKRKGHDLALKAVRILVDKGVKVRLIIGGPFRGEINQIMELYEELNLFEHVIFLHRMSFEDKLNLISQADIFLLPSLNLEAFGITAIESLACGTPVVATPSGGVSEIISKVDKRLLSKTISPEDLGKVVFWFSKLNKKEKREMKLHCRSIARKYYYPNVVYWRLEDTYTRGHKNKMN